MLMEEAGAPQEGAAAGGGRRRALAGDSKAQAGAAEALHGVVLRLAERLEQARHALRADADARVAHAAEAARSGQHRAQVYGDMML